MPAYRYAQWSTTARTLRSRRFRHEPAGPSLAFVDSPESLCLVVVPSASWATTNVWILGGYQSDFARNLTREGRRLRRSDRRSRRLDTLAAARIDARRHRRRPRRQRLRRDVRRVRATSARCPPRVDDGLWDTPSSRHEAACASGSVAVLAAIADLRSGAYDTALVVGVELEKTVPGDIAAQHLGAAAWTGHEGADAKFMWPYMFAQVADEYDRRYGIDEAHLRAIAQLNFANARAQSERADPRLDGARPAHRRRRANPVVEGRLRRFDCSQMTDGGAGVVLVTDDYLRDHPDATPDRPHRRLGAPHRRARHCGRSWTAPPTTRTCMPHVRGGRARRLRPRPRHARRPRRLRGARLLHPQRVPRHRPHRADRARRIVEGDRERRDRDRRAAADQPQRRADRRRPSRRRVRGADARSTPPSRSAARPATTRSRAQRRSARSTSAAAPPPRSASSSDGRES